MSTPESLLQNARVKRALELNKKNYKMVAIAKELGVEYTTVRRWFRVLKIPPRKNGNSGTSPITEDTLQEDIMENLNNRTTEAVELAKHDARMAEDKAMLDLAEVQSTPADKYQHYIAAAGIKLLRDSMKNLRGPKTVRELSELDQLIRRNLGLNAKNGGGTSRMQIDISILNNAKADRGEGTVRKMKPKIIDVETEDES
jgi:hypothetical protein